MAAHGAGQAARLSFAFACVALTFATRSEASDAWGGSLAVTTDYVYRGLSQSGGEPAIQGGLYAQPATGWTIGVWASTVQLGRNADTSAEVDLYLARSWAMGSDWDARVGLTHYAYPNDNLPLQYDYDELIASVSYRQRVTATATWSPKMSRYGAGRVARDREAASYELTYLQPVIGAWSFGAGAGYYDLEDLFDTGYWYWNAGFLYSWQRLQVDLAYIDADHTVYRLYGYRAGGGRWSAALTWRF